MQIYLINKIKNLGIFFFTFLTNPICFAQANTSYFITRHPGWLGIDWMEVLFSAISGSLISVVIILGARFFNKFFKSAKIENIKDGENPEEKNINKTINGSSSYKRFLQKSMLEKENKMGMVFCRGCGKKIHETAPTCPHCGAPQGIQASSENSRNVVVLIFVALGWTLVFWIGFLFIGGMIVGILHPDNASESGREFGRMLGAPLLLLALSASAFLTVLGWLPGTKRKK